MSTNARNAIASTQKPKPVQKTSAPQVPKSKTPTSSIVSKKIYAQPAARRDVPRSRYDLEYAFQTEPLLIPDSQGYDLDDDFIDNSDGGNFNTACMSDFLKGLGLYKGPTSIHTYRSLGGAGTL